MVTVIRNTRVIQTMEPVEVLEGVDVVIENDKIKKVGRNAAEGIKADKVIAGDGKTSLLQRTVQRHADFSRSPDGSDPDPQGMVVAS